MTLLKTVPIVKAENRLISLIERTFEKGFNVKTLNYQQELPQNVKRWFQSKTYKKQLDDILTEIIRHSLEYANGQLQELTAAKITAAKKEPYILTKEAVRISTELADEVVQSIVVMLDKDKIYYRNPVQLSRQIKKYWGGERYRALRFARTFSADVATHSELYSYAQRGIQVEFYAEIDDRTSPQCRTLHGTIFDADSREAAMYRCPLHHNCRSGLRPVPITREVNPARLFKNRDFRRQIDQNGNFLDGLVDEKKLRKTFKNINTFNQKYRINKLILDKDLETRIAREKGLIDTFSVGPGSKKSLANIIKDHEDEIRHKSYENCFAFGPKGKILLRKSGSKDTIIITAEEGKKLKGAVFTHNHPGSSSFSPADIRTSCGLGLKEIRIASSKYFYTMRLKDGSNFTEKMWKEIEPAMNRYNFAVRNELEDKIISGEISINDANILHWHEVWSRVVKDIPELEYSRT